MWRTRAKRSASMETLAKEHPASHNTKTSKSSRHLLGSVKVLIAKHLTQRPPRTGKATPTVSYPAFSAQPAQPQAPGPELRTQNCEKDSRTPESPSNKVAAPQKHVGYERLKPNNARRPGPILLALQLCVCVCNPSSYGALFWFRRSWAPSSPDEGCVV